MNRPLPSLSSAGVAFVLLAALSLTLTNVAAPLVYQAGGNPPTILVLRNAGFLLLCGLWLRARGRFDWLDRRRRWTCLGAGGAYTLGAGGVLFAFAYLPVSLAILVFFTFPLMTVLLQSLLERRPPGLGQTLCTLAALGGLALALEVESFAVDARGVLAATLGALGVAVSYVWTGRALPDTDSALMTFYMAVTGLLVSGLYVVATDSFALPAAGGAVWLAVAVLGFACAFFAMFRGVHLIGATPTAMVMNTEPVFTIALAVTLLSEGLSGRKVVGAALVLAAVAVSQVLARRDARSGVPA